MSGQADGSITGYTSDDIKFRNISLEQGLSQTTIYSIYQDKKGFMWFGTQDGLNRFDGYNFVVYHNNLQDSTSISNNGVWSMLEDNNGRIWIGTNNGGLDQFNPSTQSFLHWIKPDLEGGKLSRNSVMAIKKGPEGNIWFGTNGSGLLVLDKKTQKIRPFALQHDFANQISEIQIKSMEFDHNGKMWIGTYKTGVYRLDTKTGEAKHFFHDPEDPNSIPANRINDLCIDGFGMIWVATPNGLYEIDPEQNTILDFSSNERSPNALNGIQALCVFEDSDGNIWVGTRAHGLILYNRKQRKFHYYSHDPGDPFSISDNNIGCIYEDRYGTIWIGTDGKGLNTFNRLAQKFTHHRHNPRNESTLSSNMVWTIYEDFEGKAWVGTSKGLNSIDPVTNVVTRYFHSPNDVYSLPNNFVLSVTGDKYDHLWIRTKSGVVRLDQEKNKFYRYRNDPNNPGSLSNNFVWDVLSDRDGDVWISTNGGGLNRFDRNNDAFVSYKYNPSGQSISSDKVWPLYQDTRGYIWMVTDSGGVDRFDKRTGNFIHFTYEDGYVESLNKARPWKIFEDSDHHIWIATASDGLRRFNPATGKFKFYKNEQGQNNSLSSNSVRCVYFDSKNNLWIGTAGGGLNKWKRDTDGFEHWIMHSMSSSAKNKEGIANNVIYGIIGDEKDRIWMSTNHGISMFDSRSNIFKNFDLKDGLQSYEFNAGCFHKGRSGKFYFGGINGLNQFYPDSIRRSSVPPELVITDFLVSEKPLSYYAGNKHPEWNTHVSVLNEVNLPHHMNFLDIEFTALHFTIPEKNTYAYKMEGLDEDWHYVGTKRYAAYANLEPGNYIFKLIGANSDGVWNDDGIQLNINITPPYYKTLWFRALLVLALILGIISFVSYRERTLKRQKNVLEFMVTERTREIEHQKEQITLQKELVDRKNKDIMDSIFYAKRIQDAILPELREIKNFLPNSFVLYKPRDVVSGDFFWGERIMDRDGNSRVLFAVADCTGHGVPGAFMSMLGSALLNEIVNEKYVFQPDLILNELRISIINSLKQSHGNQLKEGMDVSLCALIYENNKPIVQFSGAYNNLFIVHKNTGELEEVKGDRQPVGIYNVTNPFTVKRIELEPGDHIYISSDGYPDQFGGKDGKKFKKKRFRELLIELAHIPIQDQHDKLINTYKDWTINHEQVDDICIMGVQL